VSAAKTLIFTVEGHDLGIDALLADAPGNQLRHLTAEIDDEDGVGHGTSVAARNPLRNRVAETALDRPPPPLAGQDIHLMNQFVASGRCLNCMRRHV
jgi:hypothetical protein